MRRIDQTTYEEILKFVYENPDQFTAIEVAKKFGVSGRTLYRMNDRLALPLKTYQLIKVGRKNWQEKRGKNERNVGEFFSWRQYPEGVL